MSKPRGPWSTHKILSTALGKKRVNYRQRAAFDADVEEALQKFHANAVGIYGEVHAACLLAHVLAKAAPTSQGARGRNTGVDGSYTPRPWAIKILRKHAAAIAEAFAREPAEQQQAREGRNDE
jgi:hypothetical protein